MSAKDDFDLGAALRLIGTKKSLLWSVLTELQYADQKRSSSIKRRMKIVERARYGSDVDFQLPHAWRNRRELLRTSCGAMFDLARRYEKKGKSSYDIIHPALESNLDVLIAVMGFKNNISRGMSCLRYHRRLSSMANVEADDCVTRVLDLVFAIHHQVPGYFTERVQRQSLDHRERAFLVLHVMLAQNTFYLGSPFPHATPFLAPIVTDDIGITIEHTCLLHWRLCAGLAAREARQLFRYCQYRRGNANNGMALKECQLYSGLCYPLDHWRSLQIFTNVWCNDTHEYLTDIADLLLLLTRCGVDLDFRYGKEGTILQTIFKPASQYEGSLLAVKFLALTEVGLSPDAQGCAASLKAAKLFKSSLSHVRGKLKTLYVCTALEQVDITIAALNFYQQYQQWPEALQQKVAAAEPNLIHYADEAKKRKIKQKRSDLKIS